MQPTREQICFRLQERAVERSESLESLSRFLRRNPAYLQQFVQRGTPRRLGEDDRLKLAMMLDIDERELGAREPWAPHARRR